MRGRTWQVLEFTRNRDMMQQRLSWSSLCSEGSLSEEKKEEKGWQRRVRAAQAVRFGKSKKVAGTLSS